MSKLLPSLALVLTLSAGTIVFGQSSGSSNSGSASQNTGTTSANQNAGAANQNSSAAVDDKTLTTNVNQAFAGDKVFSMGGILVSSKSGVVTLRCSLESQME